MATMNTVKNTLLNYIDPDGTQPKQAIRTALAGIIAMFLYQYCGWQQGYWIILAAVLILQINFGDTFTAKIIIDGNYWMCDSNRNFISEFAGTTPHHT